MPSPPLQNDDDPGIDVTRGWLTHAYGLGRFTGLASEDVNLLLATLLL